MYLYFPDRLLILGNSINTYLKETAEKSVDWIHLAQDEDQWRDLPLKVMKIPVPKTGLMFLEKTLFWSLEFVNYDLYRIGHEKVARLPFCTCLYYCINFCIYAMLRTRATFSWPTLYLLHHRFFLRF